MEGLNFQLLCFCINKNRRKKNEQRFSKNSGIYDFCRSADIVFKRHVVSRNKKIHKNESSTKYIVSMPAVLKYTYLTMFVFGLFLFCVFLFFMSTGNETVTMGHIWFATTFASIGLLIYLWSSRWHIEVDNRRIVIHTFFKKPIRISFTDIEKITKDSKENMYIYKNGRKIATIDALSDNYDRFEKSLKRYGKIIEKYDD